MSPISSAPRLWTDLRPWSSGIPGPPRCEGTARGARPGSWRCRGSGAAPPGAATAAGTRIRFRTAGGEGLAICWRKASVDRRALSAGLWRKAISARQAAVAGSCGPARARRDRLGARPVCDAGHGDQPVEHLPGEIGAACDAAARSTPPCRRRRVVEAVQVDGHEDIRVVGPGDGRTIGEGEVGVGGARQDGAGASRQQPRRTAGEVPAPRPSPACRRGRRRC